MIEPTTAFHDGWTFHGSPPNERVDAQRRSIISHMISTETRWNPARPHPIYSRYRRRGESELDEAFFPILWQDGYRTACVGRIAAMPSLDEIRESIEARIAALRSEMSSLQAARAALHNNSGPRTQTRKAPGIRRTKQPTRSTSPKAASEEREPTDPAQATAADAPGAVWSERSTKRAATPRKPRARNGSGRTKPRTSAEVLLAGKLEAMLGESGEGLSVAAIVKRANARAGQVRELLRERESAGQVRRTGKGRSTRWRLVTDEERIAERVAELERLSIATR